MKTIFQKTLVFFFFMLLLSSTAGFAATYYSQGSLAPNLTSSWNSVRVGGGSFPSNFTAGDIFVIQNGYTMTTSATWSVSGTGSKIQIESGGVLTATSVITVATATTFQIDNGGSYNQDVVAPMGANTFQGTEVFGATSNFAYNQAPSGTSAPTSPGYGNLTINTTSNAGVIGWVGTITQIQGDFNVTSTGTGTIRHALTANINITVSVGGNFNLSGTNTNFYLSSGSGTCSLTIGGNLNISGSALLDLANSSGAGTLNLGGNFNQTGGTFTSGSAVSTVNFIGGASSATFTQSAGTFTSTNINWTIVSGKTLENNSVATIVAVSRTMTVNGTFQINQGSFSGTTGTWTYGAGATLIFNNTSGSYGPIDAAHTYWPFTNGPTNVSVKGAGGITLSVDRTISGTFQTAAGVLTANKLILNGTAQINAGGFLTGTPTYGAASTLVYNTTSYTTTTNEFPATGVKNVTITAPSGTNTVTLDGDKTITGTLAVGTHSLNGGKSMNAGTITIGTGSMVMGDLTISTAFTCSGSSSISLSGAWSVSGFTKSTSTVTFTASGNINNATSFYNLTNSGGTRSITQNIDVANTLLVSGGQMGVTGGTGRSLTMSGNAATINITGGSIFGTDANAGNDLSLIISGTQTTLTGSVTGSLDDEKKFFNVTVSNGSTLALARGILCKYGTFTVNGTLQINANGYVQNDASYGANAKLPAYNSSTGALVYNNGGSFTNAGEWPSTSSPFSVTVQNGSVVTLSGTRSIAGTLSITALSTLITNAFQITGAGNASIMGTFKTSNVNGFSGSSSTAIANTITPVALPSGSTVEYNGAAQSVSAITYANLTISGSGIKTLIGSVTATGTLSLTAGTLSIGANTLTLDGAIINDAGNITGSITSNLVIFGSAGTINFSQSDASARSLNNLTLNSSATATLGTSLEFYGALELTSATFNVSNQSLTLKSTLNNTARIGDLTGSTLTNATNVTVERFISAKQAKRAWRWLTVPISGGNSIQSTWQIGGNSNYIIGRGSHITGPGGLSGLDAGNNYSMKTFNQSTGALDNVTSTLGSISGTGLQNESYFIFVRGDRNPDNLAVGNANETTLSATGTLKTGPQSFSSEGGSDPFMIVGNPYASPVDFGKITPSNIALRFWAWDPYLNSVGGYVLMDGFDGSYDVPTGSPSAQTQDIQSGQAIFVQRANASLAGSLTFNENNKSAGSVPNVFRTNGGIIESLVTNLYQVNGSTATFTDGVTSKYSSDYLAAVTIEDAPKFTNIGENLAIARDGTNLTIERRPLIDADDTIFLKLWNTTKRSYQFKFIPTNFSAAGLVAFLEDSYLKTSTPVSLDGETMVSFSVNNEVASADISRFHVVFKPNSVLPINFTNVKAFEKSSNIQVEWNLGNETNVSSYEVEKSVDGRAFTKAGVLAARTITNSSENYAWLDVTPNTGNNFYRIKAIEKSGSFRYSQVVNVKLSKAAGSIGVYPNPISGNALNLQLVNQPKGKYAIQLFNNLGQQVYRSEFNHAGGSSTQTIQLNGKVVRGIYQLKITAGNNNTTQKVVID